MRVAWATAEAPHHSAWGGPIRQAHLLDALAAVADVDLLVLGHVEDEAVRDAVHEVVELPPVVTAAESPTRRRIRTLLPAPPVELRGSGVARRAVARELRGRDADVVVLQHGELGALVHEGPVVPGGRVVVDLHHLASVRHEQAAATTTGRQAALHRVEARRSRRHERAMNECADQVLVCSPADAAHVPGALVVPNGVTLNGTPTPVPPTASVVFTGHLGYGPNVDAVRWLVDEVLPRVRAEVPAVEVVLVGRAPVDEIRALAARTDRVELAADVPDVGPHLRAARVAVVPVRVGSGTRLKALEAMAAGRPVVGTTIGLEGLGVVDGLDALIADDAGGFADAVVRVLRDEHLAVRLATAGRRRAETFGWDAIGRRFVEAVLG